MRLMALLTMVVVAASARAEDVDVQRWHRVVGLVQYLEGDYPAALAADDPEELAEQQGLADELSKALAALGPAGAPYRERAKTIATAIASKAPAVTVVTACHALAADIVTATGLVQAPTKPPSLDEGAKVYAELCSSCHGADGKANTPLAETLRPPPANFHDPARMGRLTPYKVFNTVSFGIAGTAMVAFPQLTTEQRWNLAFYVFTLRQPTCAGAGPEAALATLATSTDDALAAKYGHDAVTCLRRRMPQANETGALMVARAGVEDARRLFARGEHDLARQAVVDAYLQGLEPIEPVLRARNPELVGALEQAFTRTRVAAQSNQGFDDEAKELIALLNRASGTSTASGFWSVFLAALLILLREGFEATVVVGSLLAVLKKMNAVQHTRVVHAGWVSALLVGALLFVFGHALFAGANREWLETIVALGAVGLLLYAALWLNARATMSRFMTDLREQMKSALGSGSSVGLFFIAFTSVGRESVETVLFLEGLAGDSRQGVVWGAVAGLAVLGGFVALVRTVGFVLPMKTLFTASTFVLLGTAVALLGKGLHGLQELGVLSLAPVRFIRVDALGLFPDAYSLLPQLALALAAFGWWRKSTTKRTPVEPAPTAGAVGPKAG